MGRVLTLAALPWLILLEISQAAEPLDWAELQPDGWTLNRSEIFSGQDISELSDFSPEAQKLMDRLQQRLDEAPANKALTGSSVALSGYLLPLQRRQGQAYQFFLVPYFGTCIHSPPPPANQIVRVKFTEGTPHSSFFTQVQVTGTLTAERWSHRLATSAYRLDAVEVILAE